MSLYAFHLGQIISTVLGKVEHDGQHSNAARTPVWDETSETDHTQKRHFRHSAIYQTIRYKRFGYSEVLIWFRDGGFRGGHR